MDSRATGILLLALVASSPMASAATSDPPVESVDFSRWSQPPPFQRIIDLQVGALIYPDTIGFCLQADPFWFASVELCAGTLVYLVTAHLDLRLPVLHYIHMRDETTAPGSHRISGWEVGFGPLVGGRDVIPITTRILRSAPYGAIDVGLTGETVYWFRQHLGLKLQLDAGLIVGPGFGVHPILPFVESKIGVAF